MTDAPSREEIAARLEAAEARTETRFVQLNATIESRSAEANNKIDLLSTKIDSLVLAVSDLRSETRSEVKSIKSTVWTVWVGAALTILVLVVSLWVAGINVESNVISAFQAGLGERPLNHNTQSPSTPAAPLEPRK